ncbi:MAG: MFS transporter [Candidatus Bipolaricaulota bacterium]|nr:MFS transporter [Candidatus Bipolaricaulota bacterium]
MNAQEERTAPASARVNFPLATSAVLVAFAGGGLGMLVQLFLKDRGATLFLISAASSLGSVGVLVGSYFWGKLSDRAGRRGFLILTAVGVAAAIAILAPLPSNGVVVMTSFARSFMDIGFASMSLAMISAATQSATRARGMSYNSSARSLGFALGAMGAGVVLEKLGYRNGFLLMTLLPMGAALLVLRLPREPKPVPVPRQLAWHALREAGLVRLYFGTILRQFGVNGAFALLYVYMDDLGISPILMGTVSSLNTLTQVVALVAFGWVADRIGRRKVFLLGFGMSALLPCILAVSSNVPMMALSYVVLGIAFSSLYIGSTAHIGDRIPLERMGTMLGLFEMARGLGGLLGPLLAGAIVPLVGFRGMFLTMAAISGIGFLLVIGERFPFHGRGSGAPKPEVRSPVVDGGST